MPATPSVRQRSAFEILEEFIVRQEITLQMQQAAESILMIPGIAPRVITDLAQGPFNVPQEEQEADFSMIDLESGELIQQSTLQAAFSQLLTGDVPPPLLGELTSGEEEGELEQKENALTALASNMQHQAEKLDLNLDFLSPEDDFGS